MCNHIKRYINYAIEQKFALPAFNIDNMAMLRAIVTAAEATNSPVIVMTSQKAIRNMGLNYVQSIIKTAINKATVPIFWHLDHSHSLELCKSVVDAGADSVMLDWSMRSLVENIKGTTELLKYAHNKGVLVEAEVGHIGGTEDEVTSQGVPVADFARVTDFFHRCPVDLLAAAVGSVHGYYKCKPQLHFDLIQKITGELCAPLVLHGSSGLPSQQIKKSIQLGVCKVNIGTEFKDANCSAVRQFLNSHQNCYNIGLAEKAGEVAAVSLLIKKIKLCGSQGKALPLDCSDALASCHC